jgi:hypothetical protein
MLINVLTPKSLSLYINKKKVCFSYLHIEIFKNKMNVKFEEKVV